MECRTWEVPSIHVLRITCSSIVGNYVVGEVYLLGGVDNHPGPLMVFTNQNGFFCSV